MNPAPFAYREGRWIGRAQLWADVEWLAARLPDRPYLLNLCRDRYLFALALLAAARRGQVCLLPPSGLPGVMREILADYPDAYLVAETRPELEAWPWLPLEAPPDAGETAEPRFEEDRTAVIAFTSGSTGYPKPCPHSLATFRASAAMALAGLDLAGKHRLLVSTTPPQHMYGLETSLFWPLYSDLAVHAGRPFFPEDIRRTLASSPLPCLLASTPAHLRALPGSGGDWPNLAGILSSTAALSKEFARRIEAAADAEVKEIFGSTETLSFACRRPALETLWRPYPNAALLQDDEGGTRLAARHLPDPLRLQDRFRIETDGRFEVLGRDSDLIKIAGKRASLAELNRRLTDIKGIEDGVFLVVKDERREFRTVAVVVSRLDRRAILEALRASLDEVFLPRTLHYLAEIPRNEVGKPVWGELEARLAARGRGNVAGITGLER